MPTIKDIARIVGVSPTTVSNVLHGKHQRVSAETVERIRAAIEQEGYVPNMSARATLHASSGSSTIWCRWRAAVSFRTRSTAYCFRALSRRFVKTIIF